MIRLDAGEPPKGGRPRADNSDQFPTRRRRKAARSRCRNRGDRPAAYPPASMRPASAATSSPTRCAPSTFPISRSIPGASYRGLHDSLVNYLGNERPQMLLCLHEEAAVAIAHGYAKVTGKAMAAAVHSNVGLMHATMAIFNAWCDRMPMVVLGATGPVDAAKRRPWIDWIHTARDQGALVRDYTKWDDQPASPVGRARGHSARRLDRQYRALRADLRQSRRRACRRRSCRAGRRRSTLRASCRRSRTRPPPSRSRRRRALLRAAKHPVILAGRVSRSLDGLGRARRARRASRRKRRHRPESRRRLPDRSSAACRRARD